jgi:hypothetical protein
MSLLSYLYWLGLLGIQLVCLPFLLWPGVLTVDAENFI